MFASLCKQDALLEMFFLQFVSRDRASKLKFFSSSKKKKYFNIIYIMKLLRRT